MKCNSSAARAAVLHHINEHDDDLVILDDLTITKPYGWVFFFNTRLYAVTKNPLDSLGGNGPIVVESATGELTALGTAGDPKDEISAFEMKKGLSPG